VGRQVGGPAILANCIVWSVPASSGSLGGAVTATYCNIQAGFAGAGNISADPGFVSAVNFRLTHASPCLDAGSNPAYFGSPAAVLTDLAGNPRGYDSLSGSGTGLGVAPLVDMGAYEYECYANCDGSVTPPVLNVLDFTCFLNRFAAGCP
jgi:hypothetical protein